MADTENSNLLKPILWVGRSLEAIRKMPEDVQDEVGYALYEAQIGRKSRRATPLVGFGGAAVLEIKDDFDTGTYRCVYTVQFRQAIYVLHAFQKKSRRGIATPQAEMETIRRHLREAEQDYRVRFAEEDRMQQPPNRSKKG